LAASPTVLDKFCSIATASSTRPAALNDSAYFKAFVLNVTDSVSYNRLAANSADVLIFLTPFNS